MNNFQREYFCQLNANPLTNLAVTILLTDSYSVWKNTSKMIIHICVTKKDHFDNIINRHIVTHFLNIFIQFLYL